MERAERLELVAAMERAVDSADEEAAARYLTDDVVYAVGARAPVRGIAAILAYAAEQGRFARWDGHTLRGVSGDADVLVVEVESHFTRITDGRRISFPCADVYRFRGDRICDWRVYADMSPFDVA